ncbi:lanthionine synthetase LanC family protein [Streptomyces sp. WG7]|uniref:lanthionine synthetase LanC family protein n=1 Tax=Streptomyces sp. WG7 TaxID=3417650 RepID=UPI003CF907E3
MKHSGHVRQVRAAAGAVRIGDDDRVTWCGAPTQSLRVTHPAVTDDALTLHLSQLLYQAFYVFGEPLADLGEVDRPAPRSASARFCERLVRANAGKGTWRWKAPLLRREADGDGVVRCAGVDFLVPGTIAETAGDDGRLELDMPGVLLTSPGYLLFLGDSGPRPRHAERVLRFYWNVTAEGAPELVAALTETLNTAAIPFEFKVRHTDQPWPRRADPAVLYLSASHAEAAWPLLEDVRERVGPWLRPAAPALTLRLGRGLAAAEDPGHDTSFGMHRSRLVARGLVAAHRAGHDELPRRVGAVSDAFEEAGLSLHAPYLNPDSPGLDFLRRSRATGPRPPRTPTRLPSTPGETRPDSALPHPRPSLGGGHGERHGGTPDWLAEADALGERITRQALWHHGHCTWLGAPATGSARLWKPAGPELYDGLSGIGLLLAALSRRTGSAAHRRHAYGALRAALGQAGAAPETPGLYAGTAGVGWGVALAARELADDTLFTAGADLTRRSATCFLGGAREVRCELLYGTAGTVLALLGTHRLGAPGAAEVAVELGHHMVRAASRDGAGLRWDDPDGGCPAPVGLAHGASGVALALAELTEVTGDPAWCEAAEAACAYERRWFDPRKRNWADLRDAGDGLASARRDRYQWCYKAPGIALARSRVARVSTDPALVEETAVAVQATHRAAAAFPRHGHDVSLCHGAAGLADLLTLLPPTHAPARRAVRDRLLTAALCAYRDPGPWPSGCGLLTGAGGVAHASLRAAHPDVVSVLLPIPL